MRQLGREESMRAYMGFLLFDVLHVIFSGHLFKIFSHCLSFLFSLLLFCIFAVVTVLLGRG